MKQMSRQEYRDSPGVVQLFDPGFEVQVGKRSTEARYGVRIDTSHR